MLYTDLRNVRSGSLLIDRQSNRSRTGEGNTVHVRTADELGPNLFTYTRQEADHPVRNPRTLNDLEELHRHHRRLLGRLHHHRIPRDQRGRSHPCQNCQRKIPRRNHHDHTASPIEIPILFPRQIPLLRSIQAPHLLCIIPAKINRLANVPIRLGPRFTTFNHLPRRQLKPSLTHLIRHQLEIFRAILNFGS